MQATADDLARISARGWPAALVENLGDWELRASGGFTRRANSVLAIGDSGVPFRKAQEAIVEFAGQHGIPPLAQVVAESSWHRVFLEAGWEPDDSSGTADVLVQVLDLGDVPADGGVSITSVADDDWLGRYGRSGDAQLARSVLQGPERVGFATLDQRAIGRVAVTGEWAGLAAVTVDPAHRRQGLGGRVVSALLAWAAERDADKAYLQVEADKAAAIALYRRFGFSTHHRYLYLGPPSGDR